MNTLVFLKTKRVSYTVYMYEILQKEVATEVPTALYIQQYLVDIWKERFAS